MFSRIRSPRTTRPSTTPVNADEHVVEEDRRVGQDDPLGRRVADVALVPQRLVLEAGLGVAAQEPGQAGDPLAQDRVALVGHRRAALLAGPERLHELADLGVLEVADLGREALQRPAGDRDRREEGGVAVALHDLGAHRVDVQAERAEHLGLERPGRAGCTCRPGRRSCRCRSRRSAVARRRRSRSTSNAQPASLTPERRRLGVDAVGAAHHDRVGLGPGAPRRARR